ncbi:uncharacterized protein LOC111902306 [Lactuca sativa]|uniref:uncharacterized protein LOC111902306 n=1 Tax=Lactuca sativa TaxID=4236 RepID=UPI0022B00C46|nr:uncharacterized protein LOC111902306 [Lactuca sativa]
MFGGAVSTTFPLRLEDVSNSRETLDHQEVFVDPARDECLIFELLELKDDVEDNGSCTWFYLIQVTEQSAVFEAPELQFINLSAIITTVTAQMAISNARQGREAQNLVNVSFIIS